MTVRAGSIDTGKRRRDSHICSRLLDAGEYPQITFTVTRVEPAEQGVIVAGDLSLHGQTRAASFGARVISPGDGEVWLDAEVQVDRGDFGSGWNPAGLASTRNAIAVHAVFVRR